jgi:quercetin dioxygenase-like cupin family protein
MEHICASWVPLLLARSSSQEQRKKIHPVVMAAQDMHNPAEGYVQTPHPVQGLTRVVRHITGRDAEGASVFLATDVGQHHRELVDKSAIASILYATKEHPVSLDDEQDVKFARENEPGMTIKDGTVCRMIDFAPGGVSPMHRVNSLDYAVVIEGIFKLILDSGEERVMQRGDVAIQRATKHRWINVTGNGLLPGRMLFVLLDAVGSGQAGPQLGRLEKDYAGLPGHGQG